MVRTAAIAHQASQPVTERVLAGYLKVSPEHVRRLVRTAAASLQFGSRRGGPIASTTLEAYLDACRTRRRV